MSRPIKHGSVDQSTVVRIVDSTDGTPETGVTSATAGLDLQYRREGAAAVALTESDLVAVDSAHADGGIKHIGAGYYRVDLPDAAVATGADGVLVFGTVTGMVVIAAYHPLVANVEADTFARLGAPAGASVSADILAIDNLVDDLESRVGTPSDLGGGATLAANLADIEAQTDDIGAAGAGLTAVPWNAAWDAEVQSEVQDAIEANNLDHLLKIAVDTDFATTVHLDSAIGHLADAGATATFDRTTDSLEALRDRGDAAWASNGVIVGSFTSAALREFIETDALGGVPVAGSVVEAVWTVAARTITGGTITTYTGNTPQTGDAFFRLGAPAGASTAADIAAVKADTAAILADTGTDGVVLTAAERNAVADALLDRTDGVESGVTPRAYFRRTGAVLAGRVTGAGTAEEKYYGIGQELVTLRATFVCDEDGNRTSITFS